MSFVLQGEVRIDGKTAKGEIKDLERAQDKLKTSTKALSSEGKKAASGNRQMGAAARRAAADVKTLSNAERIAATNARTLGRSNQIAAGQIGNLTAQFNDIGVMLMAGQNPLQLAIQQGTQITQVIGPMGAAGAVGALKSALVGMINPVSLITIGSIAAGAAMVNWLTGAADDAASLEDIIDDAASAVEAFGTKADRARLSTSGMLAEFGTASPELQAVLADLAALGKIEAYKGIDEAADSVRNLVLEAGHWGSLSNINASKDFLGLFKIRKSMRDAGIEFARNLDLLSKSEEPAVKLRAALDVREQLLNTAGGIEGLNDAQKKFYNGLAAIIRELSVLDAKVAESERDPFAGRMAAAMAYYAQTRVESDKQQAAAEDMLATLKEENTLRWAIVKFGEDSVEVETLRAVAARAALEEEMTAKGVSEALKVEMRKVFENTLALSQLDIASPINAAALAAQTLADRLGISLDIARKVVAATGEVGGVGGDPTVGGFEANDPRGAKPGVWTGGHSTTSTWKPETKSGGGARGGAGGGADAQTQAIARLIEQQQLQLAVLRESDPVMREMLRYRTAMAGATKEERVLLEQLITTRLREEDVLGRVQETQQFFQDTTFDALDGMIARGESLSDVMKNVAASIAQAALQAALLGTGPLGSLFGGGGGLLGFIGDALFPKVPVPAAADGGYLSGPGTGTSDDILMWGSNGEFMVNAAATARHRGLLEAINSGTTPPQLAAGGLLATSPPSRTFGTRSPRSGANRPNEPAPALVTLRIKPSREFTTQIEETAERISVEVVGDYDRDVIPGSVQRVLENPRRVG
ncbi:MAG: hypothetical protein COC12_07010 [Rhodobacteraceae bacterium]|nr:MAG: hypothetical protein COC12_07010 [Paracoccaceae bacterium]